MLFPLSLTGGPPRNLKISWRLEPWLETLNYNSIVFETAANEIGIKVVSIGVNPTFKVRLVPMEYFHYMYIYKCPL